MNLRLKLRKIRLITFLASIKLTVLCLFLLFVLTIWGTIAQVHSGLYIAQQRFFHSFFFLILGFIPFPGGQLVMWILFANLICVALIRLVYKWRHIGIIIIHLGLLLFLISGFVTLRCSEESFVTLFNGQATNISSAYHDWELSIWKQQEEKQPLKTERKVLAVDTKSFRPNQTIALDDFGLQLYVKDFHKNCNAYIDSSKAPEVINQSGIRRLEAVDLDKDPQKNIPGGIFRISDKSGKSFDVLLYGGETEPASFKIEDTACYMMLRLKRYPLPILLKLIEFIREYHPGTQTPRSFKSQVAIELNGASREKLISMNNPLRFKDYTFYQASFAVDEMDRESSTLAVVKNSGRILPYIATFVTFTGLLIHFLMIALTSKKKYESPFINDE